MSIIENMRCGIAQAKKDGEDVTLSMIVALVVAVSFGAIVLYGWASIPVYLVGVVAGVLLEAVIVHIQRYC